MTSPTLHLIANIAFNCPHRSQKMCVISSLNLTNFKCQPLDFFVLLPARPKSCHPWFPASITFQCMFPHPFSSYTRAVPHPYLEINYVHIPRIYTQLTLNTPAALHSQGLQVQAWLRWGWRWFTGQNPGDNYHWLLKGQDLSRLVVLIVNNSTLIIPPFSQEWEFQPVSWQIFISGNYVLPS